MANGRYCSFLRRASRFAICHEVGQPRVSGSGVASRVSHAVTESAHVQRTNPFRVVLVPKVTTRIHIPWLLSKPGETSAVDSMVEAVLAITADFVPLARTHWEAFVTPVPIR